MATIHHQVSIEAPLGTVYQAIATPEKIGTWWDKQTAVQTDRGLVLEHNPGPEHGVVKMRVVEQAADQRVEWECISNHPTSSPASAWTGTRLRLRAGRARQPRRALRVQRARPHHHLGFPPRWV